MAGDGSYTLFSTALADHLRCSHRAGRRLDITIGLI
jgi:hypothetical protein